MVTLPQQTMLKNILTSIFSKERYDFSLVGRHRFNKRFGLPLEGKEVERRNFTKEDLG
jgi:hypothetical protein